MSQPRQAKTAQPQAIFIIRIVHEVKLTREKSIKASKNKKTTAHRKQQKNHKR